MAAPGVVLQLPPAPPAPVGGAPPALQLPYGADPGTFTGWLLQDTATLTENDVVESIVGALQKHTLPAADAAGYDEALQSLMDGAISSDDINCFVEVSSSAQGAEIGIVSSLARYSAGFGVASIHNGCVFGLRGEVVDAVQLPPLVQVPRVADGGIASLFSPRPCVVPSAAQITAHYANPIMGRLMAPPENALPAHYSSLLFVPKEWAPYFLRGQSPSEAYGTATTLVASLSTDHFRGLVGPWLDWFAAACVRLGHVGADRRLSVFHTPWQGTIAEPRLVSWAANRCAPYRLPVPVPAGPTGFQMDAAPPVGRVPAEATFTPLETLQLMAACSLPAADFTLSKPQIYLDMMQEGRSKNAVDRILSSALRPDPESEHPVNVFVSDELIADVKSLNFGYHGSLDYSTCHRGISPFAVSPLNAEQMSSRHRHRDRMARATTLTPQEVERTEATTSSVPTDYNGLVALLFLISAF